MTKSEAGKLGAIASKKIIDKLNAEKIEHYLENPVLCLECNSLIPYRSRKNKFCNHSCSAKYNNRNIKNSQGICLYCGNSTKNMNFEFCCVTCRFNFITFEQVWRGLASSRTTKKYLILLYGEKCSVCNIKSWNNKPLTFELEHIDGNSDNNSLDNVCLVCPNCHSQTSTYKSKNIGNGRYLRRLRYIENKSY